MVYVRTITTLRGPIELSCEGENAMCFACALSAGVAINEFAKGAQAKLRKML